MRSGAGDSANHDINPSEDLIGAYPALACLLRNEAISSAFAGFEDTAMRWKRFYIFFGRVSLIAVLLAMASFDYQMTLERIYGAPSLLAGVAAAFAATGLFSQILLGVTHAKERWLLARFAAERLRCFKFQLFTVLEEVSDAERLPTEIKWRTEEGLAALQRELAGGRSAITEFSPAAVLAPPRERLSHGDRALLDDAAAIYDSLRFSVEERHFDHRFHDYDRETRLPALLSEISFVAGVVMGCIGILSAILPARWPLSEILNAPAVAAWVHFLIWLLFVLSAVIAIHERGGAHQQNAERYVTFGREIRRIRATARTHMPNSFFHAAREMEHLMLREIRDFCRDVRHSNYIF